MWKNEKDSEGRPNKTFLVTYGEAETRATVFPADLKGIKCVLEQMLLDLLDINRDGAAQFGCGMADFFGRVTAYKHNLLRVSRPESIPELFTYEGDIPQLFAEGVTTAAVIVERISQEGTPTLDIKRQADQLRRWLVGLAKI